MKRAVVTFAAIAVVGCTEGARDTGMTEEERMQAVGKAMEYSQKRRFENLEKRAQKDREKAKFVWKDGGVEYWAHERSTSYAVHTKTAFMRKHSSQVGTILGGSVCDIDKADVRTLMEKESISEEMALRRLVSDKKPRTRIYDNGVLIDEM